MCDSVPIHIPRSRYNKTATRLGEAGWLTFAPAAAKKYEVDKLGSWTDPLDTVDGGGKSLHGLTEGVRVTAAGGKTLFVRSLDAGVVRFDKPMPTPTPIFNQPDMSQGMSFGLFMNTWNTNYAYWWPYVGSPGSTANCNLNANYFSEFSIENAEMMENRPWKMMILY